MSNDQKSQTSEQTDAEQPHTLEQEIEILAERFPKIAELLRAAGKFLRV